MELERDEERWMRDVLTDFRIPFDDHEVGRRVALTGWMISQLEAMKVIQRMYDDYDDLAKRANQLEHLVGSIAGLLRKDMTNE